MSANIPTWKNDVLYIPDTKSDRVQHIYMEAQKLGFTTQTGLGNSPGAGIDLWFCYQVYDDTWAIHALAPAALLWLQLNTPT